MGHFWSNFEIVPMDYYNDGVYSTFLECINMSCESFHERWEDASMHYMAVSIFRGGDKLHYFDGFAYFHQPNGLWRKSIEEGLVEICDSDG